MHYNDLQTETDPHEWKMCVCLFKVVTLGVLANSLQNTVGDLMWC